MIKRLCVVTLICATTFFGCNASAGEDVLTSTLLSLLKEGKLEQCIDLSTKDSDATKHDPQTLYVSGICALRSNHPYIAREKLSQLLVVSPQFPGAWFAKAQTDYMLVDRESLNTSRTQLESAPLPEELKKPVNTWLKSLQTSEKRSVVSFHGGIGTGYNSNANAGTTESDYLGAALPSSVKKTSSAQFETTLGISATKGLSTYEEIFGALSVTRKTNSSASFVNQSVVTLVAGYQRPVRGWTVSSFVRAFDERVAGTKQREYGALEFTAFRRISDTLEISGGLRAGRLNYRIPTRPDLDIWRFHWNISATRLFGTSLRNRVGFGITGGGDEEVIYRSSYGNSRVGLRTYANIAVGKRTTISGEANYSLTSFDVHGGFSGITRLDKQNSILANLSWKPKNNSRWSVQIRAAHRQLNSNVSVFAFNQNQIGLFLSYQDK